MDERRSESGGEGGKQGKSVNGKQPHSGGAAGANGNGKQPTGSPEAAGEVKPAATSTVASTVVPATEPAPEPPSSAAPSSVPVAEPAPALAQEPSSPAPEAPVPEAREIDPRLMKFVGSQIEQIVSALPEEAREDFKEAMRRTLGMPATPDTSVAPQSPGQSPGAQAQAQVQEPPKPVLDLSKFGVKKNYAGALPAGYHAESPGLLYSPHVNLDPKTNKPRILEVLAVDVSNWGNQPVIIAIPATDVRVLMPDGTIFDNVETETDSRVPIVIFVDGDCTNIHRDLLENPDYGIVCCWVPSFEQPLSDGTNVLRHLVGRAESIPKKGIWPPG